MKINLLPQEERPLNQFEVRWEFLVGLIAILALGAVLLFSWTEQGQVASLTRDHNEAVARELILQRQVQSVQELRSNVSDLAAQEEEYQALLYSKDESLSSLPEVMGHAVSQLWIESVVWRVGQISLSGYTRSMTSLSQYLNYLNEMSFEANLATVYPREDTGFMVFMVDVKGAVQ